MGLALLGNYIFMCIQGELCDVGFWHLKLDTSVGGGRGWVGVDSSTAKGES